MLTKGYKMKKVNSLKDLKQLMEHLGAQEEKGDGWSMLTLDCGPGAQVKHVDLSNLDTKDEIQE